jgi:hypothetical protein
MLWQAIPENSGLEGEITEPKPSKDVQHGHSHPKREDESGDEGVL